MKNKVSMQGVCMLSRHHPLWFPCVSLDSFAKRLILAQVFTSTMWMGAFGALTAKPTKLWSNRSWITEFNKFPIPPGMSFENADKVGNMGTLVSMGVAKHAVPKDCDHNTHASSQHVSA